MNSGIDVEPEKPLRITPLRPGVLRRCSASQNQNHHLAGQFAPHRRQNHNHPRPLFTVLHTLQHQPAIICVLFAAICRASPRRFRHQCRSVFQPMRHLSADRFLTQQIRQELLKTHTVVSKEFLSYRFSLYSVCASASCSGSQFAG